MTITVVAETEAGALTTPSLECLEEARDLANELGTSVRALLPGHQVAGLADIVVAHGAQAVTIVDHQALSHFSAEGWLAALESPLKEAVPDLILTVDSAHTRAWLPRLAARWRWPLFSGCSQVRLGPDGHLEITRPVHSGLQLEKVTVPDTMPLLVTLLPGVRGVSSPEATSPSQAKVIHLTPDLDPSLWRDRTTHRLPPDTATMDISEAERVVSGGLGLGGPEGIDMLWQLAKPLQATVAGTRVISDRGWLPHERYIGSTGKTVAPKLYLALGISGASQHTVGMSDSETIIAINTDRTAPIFGLADLGIVGDLHQIVPALLARLAEKL